MNDFISEDNLNTFEGWLKYQAVDPTAIDADELAMWQSIFEERSPTPKLGLMKLESVAGEFRYGVAVRDGEDLWLTLWIKRSPKGEYFVMLPRSKGNWDPHSSYHIDGRLHMKSHGRLFGPVQKRQPLTATFRGTESLGAYGGHAPKSVGAVCDPDAFTSVMEVAPGLLGPSQGVVIVDLIEPDCEPLPWPVAIAQQKIFRENIPWIVVRICP